jgi:hypothetical protein
VWPKVTENKQSKRWCAQGDDFRTFLTGFVADLTRIEWSPDLTL